MSTTYDLPLPNDRYDGAIVIASVWGNDMPDEGVVCAELVLLQPAPPYFSVVQIEMGTEGWRTCADHGRFWNIVEAIDEYQQNGGDI